MLSLGILAACSSGKQGGNQCATGAACTPAGGVDPCRVHATTCESSTAAQTCSYVADVADYTDCGAGKVCFGGACKPQLRTVSGTLKATHWIDNGTKTTVNEPLPWARLTSLLVPKRNSAGYTALPLSLDANQSFSATAVPVGPYFVELDFASYAPCRSCIDGFVQVISARLIELTADTPDFTRVTASRPDLVKVASGFPPAFNLSGLDPWMAGDSVHVAGSQSLSYDRPQVHPSLGATSYDGAYWFTEGYPDASKGDTLFVYQRSVTNVGNGASAATAAAATRYARLNNVTLTPASTTPISAALVAAPQTGSVRLDVRYSQFAALTPQVHPQAVVGSYPPGVVVRAVPRSVSYPDMPPDALELTTTIFSFESTSLFLLSNLAPISVDADYGTLHYGEFLEPNWQMLRGAWFSYDVNAPGPNGGAYPLTGYVISRVPMSDDPILPVLGPPTQPRIEGRDGFAGQSGVGLEPTLTWSAPLLGRATSYQVRISNLLEPVAGETRELLAIVHTGMKFRVPVGVLKVGNHYSAVITAVQAPWDLLDQPPFQRGLPFHAADCVMGAFTP
jgi:hypothetical protein